MYARVPQRVAGRQVLLGTAVRACKPLKNTTKNANADFLHAQCSAWRMHHQRCRPSTSCCGNHVWQLRQPLHMILIKFKQWQAESNAFFIQCILGAVVCRGKRAPQQHTVCLGVGVWFLTEAPVDGTLVAYTRQYNFDSAGPRSHPHNR